MLTDAPVYASLPTTDLARTRRFYEEALGLAVADLTADSVSYRAGKETALFIYERPASRAEHTVAFFTVDDLPATVAGLRERGVAFIDYDRPDLKTSDGIFSGSGMLAAWFEDPDGNVLGLFANEG